MAHSILYSPEDALLYREKEDSMDSREEGSSIPAGWKWKNSRGRTQVDLMLASSPFVFGRKKRVKAHLHTHTRTRSLWDCTHTPLNLKCVFDSSFFFSWADWRNVIYHCSVPSRPVCRTNSAGRSWRSCFGMALWNIAASGSLRLCKPLYGVISSGLDPPGVNDKTYIPLRDCPIDTPASEKVGTDEWEKKGTFWWETKRRRRAPPS